jgi:hypothetical protein
LRHRCKRFCPFVALCFHSLQIIGESPQKIKPFFYPAFERFAIEKKTSEDSNCSRG